MIKKVGFNFKSMCLDLRNLLLSFTAAQQVGWWLLVTWDEGYTEFFRRTVFSLFLFVFRRMNTKPFLEMFDWWVAVLLEAKIQNEESKWLWGSCVVACQAASSFRWLKCNPRTRWNAFYTRWIKLIRLTWHKSANLIFYLFIITDV